MAFLYVCRNKSPRHRKQFPYLLQVQSNALESYATRVVIPIASVKPEMDRLSRILFPLLPIQSKHYFLITPQLGAIDAAQLGDWVENLSDYRSEIMFALDYLVTGS